MNKKALTLLELVFSLSLVIFLVGSILFLYVVVMRGSSELRHRTGVGEKLYFALERVSRDARNANAISVANHALRFTVSEGGSDTSYIYYLYNAADSWVPAYNQTSYDLRRAPLTGGINGTFTYGAGTLIASGLLPPAANSTITSSGNVAILKLVGSENNSTLTVRRSVLPRNV